MAWSVYSYLKKPKRIKCFFDEVFISIRIDVHGAELYVNNSNAFNSLLLGGFLQAYYSTCVLILQGVYESFKVGVYPHPVQRKLVA